MHFKAFARSLEEQGVDLKKVNISKSVRFDPTAFATSRFDGLLR
jgi:hypothetical protein